MGRWRSRNASIRGDFEGPWFKPKSIHYFLAASILRNLDSEGHLNLILPKAEATRNRPPYVIVLYKRQERQNVGFKKKKKKKLKD